MDILIKPSKLHGSVNAVSSKSDAHRALICAALADRASKVSFNVRSKDIEATVNSLNALGANIVFTSYGAKVQPIGNNLIKKATVNCNESGSTIRFLIPVAGALGTDAEFTGSQRLSQRPIEPMRSEMIKNGCSFSRNGVFPLKVSGRLSGSDFKIAGNISSQFVTGLLFALPIIGSGKIELMPPVESEKYIDMTVNTMRKFGINVIKDGNTFIVPPGSRYTVLRDEYAVEGDWSNSAFFLAAGALGDAVTVTGLNMNSLQGDKKIVDIIKAFGAEVDVQNNEVTVKKSRLKSVKIDASQIPDLVPIISVLASYADGETKVCNAGRLRIKECDRLAALSTSLTSMGCKLKETQDGLNIIGSSELKFCETNSYNDHRMVMAMAVAGTFSNGVTIKNAQAVEKSYPDFFRDFNSLEGKAYVL